MRLVESFLRKELLKKSHHMELRKLTEDLMKNLAIITIWDDIISTCSEFIQNDSHYDILHSIIFLYLKVRVFGHAKRLTEQYKIKNKLTKTKALRKQLDNS